MMQTYTNTHTHAYGCTYIHIHMHIRWDVRLEVPVLWKDYCKNMMQTYTERTTGSFMEESKVASLTWHYGNTDPQVSVCRSVCRFVGLFVGLFCFADVELWQHRSSSLCV